MTHTYNFRKAAFDNPDTLCNAFEIILGPIFNSTGTYAGEIELDRRYKVARSDAQSCLMINRKVFTRVLTRRIVKG